jgi:hypothetical protein
MREMRNAYKFWIGNPEETNCLEDIDTVGNMILKRISEK